MTVAEFYLRTDDNEQIVIAELDKVLYNGLFVDVPEKYLHRIIRKIGVDYEKRLMILCI